MLANPPACWVLHSTEMINSEGNAWGHAWGNVWGSEQGSAQGSAQHCVWGYVQAVWRVPQPALHLVLRVWQPHLGLKNPAPGAGTKKK